MTVVLRAPAGECLVARLGSCKLLVERERAMRKGKAKTKELKMSEPGLCSGKSIREHIEDELDVVVERLMNDWGADYDPTGDETDTVLKWGEERGQAQGLAFALAVLCNPFYADVEDVKNSAMLRYEAAQEEDEPAAER